VNEHESDSTRFQRDLEDDGYGNIAHYNRLRRAGGGVRRLHRWLFESRRKDHTSAGLFGVLPDVATISGSEGRPQAVDVKSIIFAGIMLAGMTAAPLTGQSATPPAPADIAANDQGKAIFSTQCGKCHDADGSKKLADGTTLLGRLAKNKDPESRLATRLKNPQERHQVFLYLQPMIEREGLSGATKKAP